MEYSDSSDEVRQTETNQSSSQVVLVEQGDIVAQAKEPSQLVKPLIVLKAGLKPSNIWLFGWLGVTGIAIIAGVSRWFDVHSYEETNKAYITSDIFAVNARVPGKVVNVTAKENQSVKKGTLLVKLNSKEYETKLQHLKVSLAISQEQFKAAAKSLSEAKTKITTNKKINPVFNITDSSVVQARNAENTTRTQLRRLEPNFIKVELERDRLAKLHAKGLISQKTLENTKVKYNILAQERKILDEKVKQAQTKLMRSQLGFLGNQENLARKTVSKIQTQLNSLEVEIQKTKREIENYQNAKTRLAKQEINLKNSNSQTSNSQTSNSQTSNSQNIKATSKKNQQQIDLPKVESALNAKLAEKKKLTTQKESQEKRITQISKQKELVTLLAEAEINKYKYEISQQRYKLIQNVLSTTQKQIKAAEYQLYYTKITAPNNGQVNIKRVQAGQKVTSGQTLMSVVPRKPWIAANFEPEQLKKIKPGQQVKIKIPQLSSLTFIGKVQSISSKSESKSEITPSKPPVKISFEKNIWANSKLQIPPGTPVTVRVKLQ
jgi:multidrug resistance efflux pump